MQKSPASLPVLFVNRDSVLLWIKSKATIAATVGKIPKLYLKVTVKRCH